MTAQYISGVFMLQQTHYNTNKQPFLHGLPYHLSVGCIQMGPFKRKKGHQTCRVISSGFWQGNIINDNIVLLQEDIEYKENNNKKKKSIQTHLRTNI